MCPADLFWARPVVEALHLALQREVREESGIEITVLGITGVYANVERGILNIVFRGIATGGTLCTSEETVAVGFFPITTENVGQYITRPHFRARWLDPVRGGPTAYEAFRLHPYRVIERFAE